jgi:hypothetical protein
MLKLPVVRVSIFLAVSLGMFGSAACQERQRRPNRYVIPAGYVGWVRINYRVKGAPVLPIEDRYYVLKFPANGILNTSSEGEEGFASDEYYYYSEDGRRPIPSSGGSELIWGGVAFGSKTVPGHEPTRYEEFFVGSEEQFKQVGLKCKDSELNHIIGPIEKCSRNAQDPSMPMKLP